ncbi:unnamed protein product [Didymodactylos carnosus]|uniref:Uncharacterized protein n=1 Tax=Didymodactylos carnosus TaxID=1234261 RepID=A0A8S2I0Y9_9BILA|nr:unnamed protein product [Didymodactylos carnosus]CAF3707176.1 unnamed protein product [Didymodactylos carnosus]
MLRPEQVTFHAEDYNSLHNTEGEENNLSSSFDTLVHYSTDFKMNNNREPPQKMTNSSIKQSSSLQELSLISNIYQQENEDLTQETNVTLPTIANIDFSSPQSVDNLLQLDALALQQIAIGSNPGLPAVGNNQKEEQQAHLKSPPIQTASLEDIQKEVDRVRQMKYGRVFPSPSPDNHYSPSALCSRVTFNPFSPTTSNIDLSSITQSFQFSDRSSHQQISTLPFTSTFITSIPESTLKESDETHFMPIKQTSDNKIRKSPSSLSLIEDHEVFDTFMLSPKPVLKLPGVAVRTVQPFRLSKNISNSESDLRQHDIHVNNFVGDSQSDRDTTVSSGLNDDLFIAEWDKERNLFQDYINSLRTEIRVLLQEREEYQTNIRQLKENLSDRKRLISNTTQNTEVEVQHISEINSLESKITLLQKALEEKNAVLELLQTEYEMLKEKNVQLQRKISLYRSDMKSQVGVIDELKQKITELCVNLQNMIIVKKRHELSIEQLEQEIRQVDEEKQKLTHHVSSTSNEKYELEKKLQQAYVHIAEQGTQLEILRSENVQIRSQLNETQRRQLQEKQQIMDYLKQVESDLIEREQIKVRENLLKQELKQVNELRNQDHAQLKQLQDQIQQDKLKLDKYENERVQLLDTIKEIDDKSSSDQHDANHEILSLKAKLVDLQTSCSSLTEQNLQLVADINLSKADLKHFVNHLKSPLSENDKILLPSDPLLSEIYYLIEHHEKNEKEQKSIIDQHQATIHELQQNLLNMKEQNEKDFQRFLIQFSLQPSTSSSQNSHIDQIISVYDWTLEQNRQLKQIVDEKTNQIEQMNKDIHQKEIKLSTSIQQQSSNDSSTDYQIKQLENELLNMKKFLETERLRYESEISNTQNLFQNEGLRCEQLQSTLNEQNHLIAQQESALHDLQRKLYEIEQQNESNFENFLMRFNLPHSQAKTSKNYIDDIISIYESQNRLTIDKYEQKLNEKQNSIDRLQQEIDEQRNLMKTVKKNVQQQESVLLSPAKIHNISLKQQSPDPSVMSGTTDLNNFQHEPLSTKAQSKTEDMRIEEYQTELFNLQNLYNHEHLRSEQFQVSYNEQYQQNVEYKLENQELQQKLFETETTLKQLKDENDRDFLRFLAHFNLQSYIPLSAEKNNHIDEIISICERQNQQLTYNYQHQLNEKQNLNDRLEQLVGEKTSQIELMNKNIQQQQELILSSPRVHDVSVQQQSPSNLEQIQNELSTTKSLLESERAQYHNELTNIQNLLQTESLRTTHQNLTIENLQQKLLETQTNLNKLDEKNDRDFQRLYSDFNLQLYKQDGDKNSYIDNVISIHNWTLEQNRQLKQLVDEKTNQIEQMIVNIRQQQLSSPSPHIHTVSVQQQSPPINRNGEIENELLNAKNLLVVEREQFQTDLLNLQNLLDTERLRSDQIQQTYNTLSNAYYELEQQSNKPEINELIDLNPFFTIFQFPSFDQQPSALKRLFDQNKQHRLSLSLVQDILTVFEWSCEQLQTRVKDMNKENEQLKSTLELLDEQQQRNRKEFNLNLEGMIKENKQLKNIFEEKVNEIQQLKEEVQKSIIVNQSEPAIQIAPLQQQTVPSDLTESAKNLQNLLEVERYQFEQYKNENQIIVDQLRLELDRRQVELDSFESKFKLEKEKQNIVIEQLREKIEIDRKQKRTTSPTAITDDLMTNDLSASGNDLESKLHEQHLLTTDVQTRLIEAQVFIEQLKEELAKAEQLVKQIESWENEDSISNVPAGEKINDFLQACCTKLSCSKNFDSILKSLESQDQFLHDCCSKLNIEDGNRREIVLDKLDSYKKIFKSVGLKEDNFDIWKQSYDEKIQFKRKTKEFLKNCQQKISSLLTFEHILDYIDKYKQLQSDFDEKEATIHQLQTENYQLLTFQTSITEKFGTYDNLLQLLTENDFYKNYVNKIQSVQQESIEQLNNFNCSLNSDATVDIILQQWYQLCSMLKQSENKLIDLNQFLNEKWQQNIPVDEMRTNLDNFIGKRHWYKVKEIQKSITFCFFDFYTWLDRARCAESEYV